MDAANEYLCGIEGCKWYGKVVANPMKHAQAYHPEVIVPLLPKYRPEHDPDSPPGDDPMPKEKDFCPNCNLNEYKLENRDSEVKHLTAQLAAKDKALANPDALVNWDKALAHTCTDGDTCAISRAIKAHDTRIIHAALGDKDAVLAAAKTLNLPVVTSVRVA